MKQKIVTIGGGTAHSLLLSGLKQHKVNISAIVNVVDSGGSTGRLRKSLNCLSYGDIRQCMFALSNLSEEFNSILSYRFQKGEIKGHNVGNLLLAAAEMKLESPKKGLKFLHDLLKVDANVIPASYDDIHVVARFKDGRTVVGEHDLETTSLKDLRSLKLKPKPRVNKEAVEAIKEADKIVISAGNIYRSIIPVLLIDEISNAIRKSQAKKIYVCNLMTQRCHTTGFLVNNFVEEIEKYVGVGQIENVIYNTKKITESQMDNKESFEMDMVEHDGNDFPDKKYIGEDLVLRGTRKKLKGDLIKRTTIQHNNEKLGRIIVKL